jgi:hypothetical protein
MNSFLPLENLQLGYGLFHKCLNLIWAISRNPPGKWHFLSDRKFHGGLHIWIILQHGATPIAHGRYEALSWSQLTSLVVRRHEHPSNHADRVVSMHTYLFVFNIVYPANSHPRDFPGIVGFRLYLDPHTTGSHGSLSWTRELTALEVILV